MNFYAVRQGETLAYDTDLLHIGKSSVGWQFSFRAYLAQEGLPVISNWQEWQRVLPEYDIYDEEDRPVTLGEFMALVEAKRRAPHNHAREFGPPDWTDGEGYSFSPREFC